MTKRTRTTKAPEVVTEEVVTEEVIEVTEDNEKEVIEEVNQDLKEMKRQPGDTYIEDICNDTYHECEVRYGGTVIKTVKTK